MSVDNGAATMRCALMLVDVQRDYLARPDLEPPSDILVGRLSMLLAGCRGLAMPILHVRTLIHADGGNRMPHWRRDDRWMCVEGTPGAEAPSELAALPTEAVIGKPFYSAFGNAQVDRTLREAGVDTLIAAGTYTHACVRASVLDAHQQGYTVWLAVDGAASYDPAHATMSVRHLDGRACEALAIDAILARAQRGMSSAM